MSFVIDKTVTDKPPKKTVVSQFTGNNSILGTLRLTFTANRKRQTSNCNLKSTVRS